MIAIDAGNSRVKWALFEHDEMRECGVFEYPVDYANTAVCLDIPLSDEDVVVSSVVSNRQEQALIDWIIKSGCRAVYRAMSQAQQKGVINGYKKPETLGVDRWLALLAAYHLPQRKGRACCVVDCGTAATLDLLEPDGRHAGGVIMPGYRLMLESLTGGTAMAQDVMAVMQADRTSENVADNTASAIRKGSMSLLCHGLYGQIVEAVEGIENECLVVLTGGDADMIAPRLRRLLADESRIELVVEPALVLKGINVAAQEREILQLLKNPG